MAASDPNAGDFCPPAVYPVPDATGKYPITRGQVLGVLPFGNVSATLTINGAELKDYLETAVSSLPATGNGRFAQVSGLCFTFDIEGTPASFTATPTMIPGTGNRVHERRPAGRRRKLHGSCDQLQLGRHLHARPRTTSRPAAATATRTTGAG